ncbi:MAG: ABC transporter ATP-binding protein, partial [candidate division KSB1 bacterium]|nr:ABC transporter ATP-binding protein [candidate division KSB1 bacterium]
SYNSCNSWPKTNSSNSSNSWQENTIWALKDVSFEVKRGEVAGIIGRNGAGKSTLLKILSRITEPTSGRAEIHGRVGSLLEVGTGFHPELTGRENIYLNGAILGMRKHEIDRKFDEIVAFAEIERFLDTPVKRYSSGMYVRLAFAVAAHLEPEILLVDEVLAVGDAAFQKKCLGKMGDVAREGRTVLFVSHNMAAVANLCQHALLIEKGEVIQRGNTQDVVQAYIANLEPAGKQSLHELVIREGTGAVRFVDFDVRDSAGEKIDVPMCGQDVTFELSYQASADLNGKPVVMSIGFYNLMGQPLFLCRSDLTGTDLVNLPTNGIVRCRVPKLPLPPGRFRVNLHCEVNGMVADWVRDALILDVVEGDFFGSGRLPSRERGDLLVEHEWLVNTSNRSTNAG